MPLYKDASGANPQLNSSPKQAFQRNRVYFYSKKLYNVTNTVNTFLFHNDTRNILTDEEKKLVKEIHEKLEYLYKNRKINYYKKKQEIFKDDVCNTLH